MSYAAWRAPSPIDEGEQLCRYITRPALGNKRVQTTAAGQVVLKLKTAWRDGTTHLAMSPLVDGLAKFRDDKAVQRWRHRLNLDWDQGPFGLTLVNTYLSGYRDQNVPGLAAPEWSDRDVEAHSIWDLKGSWRFNEQLRLRAGVSNLLDTAPPFTNQSRYIQGTWDPTYGDPRGRSVYASVDHSFK